MKSLRNTLVMALLLFATSGLASGCISLQDGNLNITVRISADRINQLIALAGERVITDNGQIVGEIDSIEMVEPNVVRIHGSYNLPQGGTTTGSMDMAFSAQGGTIKVEVVDVDADGLNLDSEPIRQLNEELEQSFAQDLATHHEGDGGVTSVQIVEDALEINISAPLN